jgi:hypothetical protein
MRRFGWAGRMTLVGAAMAAVLLLAPAGAAAKFPAGNEDEPAPGVTVTGIGFGRSNADAVKRAVADAHRRGNSVAVALNLELGAITNLDLPELAQFGSPFCPGPPERRRRCKRQPQEAAAARVTFAVVGGASGEGPAPAIEAYGSASASIEPHNRTLSRSIKAALSTARRRLAPEAVTSALRSARSASAAAGLNLGPVVSVAEATSPAYYGSAFYEAALGSFGPGRFCGISWHAVTRRDPDTGDRRVVRRVLRRRCFFPSLYSVSFSVVYEGVG